VLEAAGGVLLWLVGPTTILAAVTWLTQTEVSADPTDLIARTLMGWAHGFSIEVEHFYAVYLLAHGLVKIALVAGLLSRARWAYPTSLVVLAMFVVYQLYRFSFTHGLALLVLTVFDLFVIALIWREWRRLAAA
jgi:uncharacterized membrane protein